MNKMKLDWNFKIWLLIFILGIGFCAVLDFNPRLFFFRFLPWEILYLSPGLVVSYFILRRQVSPKSQINALLGLGAFSLFFPFLFFKIRPFPLNAGEGFYFFFNVVTRASLFLISFFAGKYIVTVFIRNEQLSANQIYFLAWKTSLAVAMTPLIILGVRLALQK